MGRMRVLGREGDIVITWDPDDDGSVKKAREEWRRLKADGYEFFESRTGPGKPKRVTRFSMKLGEVVAAPGVKKPEDKQAGTRKKAMAGGPVARRVV